MAPKKRLYRGAGTKERERAEFRKRYGAKGDKVYGATVGKVKRQRQAKYGHKKV